MTYEYREITAKDGQHLVQFFQQFVTLDQARLIADEEIVGNGYPDSRVFVCFDNDKIIGHIRGVRSTNPIKGHRVQLDRIGVLENYRKQGIFRTLFYELRKAFDYIESPIFLIELPASEEVGIKSAESLGFVRFSQLPHGYKIEGKYDDEIQLHYQETIS